VTHLRPGTYADLRTGQTFTVAPLYRGVAVPVTRDAITAHNVRVADTGERVYRHARSV
jgi:hypothetical protein